ncbi:MAG TPA: Hsp70 family protein [Mycobacterium sp.]|nr:Hsp70 family protein [Mycobacterium sp.]
MRDPLGLSVGVINLRAVRGGQPQMSRRAVLTLFDQRPPEVGLPEENPGLTGTGLMVGGFVGRVGDPAPVVAADGSSYRGEELTTDALAALARLAGYGAPVCIAVPAHWAAGRLTALQAAVRSRPGLNPRGVPPLIVSDAAAAVTALSAEPGLPSEGVVAVCDFGGSGTSITLVDAATNYRPIAATVRYGALSGAQLDQTILNHLLGRLPASGTTDSAGTAAISSLTRLRDECRAAKERLSEQTATVVRVDLPEFSGDVRLSRDELQNIVAAPLAGVIDTMSDMLSRNSIPATSLVAVAIIGGGANLPTVGAQLSEWLRVPLVATAQPGSTAAIGAALLAGRQAAPAGAAGIGPADDAPTSLASAGWAAGAAGAAAVESAADGDQSATFRALAWSQDDSKAYEPVPFSGADYASSTVDAGTGWEQTGHPAEPEPTAWYRRPVLLFSLAAALLLAATGGLAYTLTGEADRDHGTRQPPAPSTVTITAPNGSTSLSTIPPPSDTDTEPEPSATTAEPSTTTAEPSTTTEPPSTTTQPSTTQASTTQASTTQATTSAAPSSTAQPTQAPPSTTAAHPTTALPTGSG